MGVEGCCNKKVMEEEALVKKITGLAAAIGELPSLSPSPAVNALFTELVTSCIPASTVDVDALGPEAQEMRARLIRLCADAEGHLEAHYSDLLAAHDNPLDHLTLFPYFNKDYIKLSQLEHGLLRHVPGPAPARVAFLGSGPLPLSSLVLAARHLPDASFDNYDISGEANGRASRLVRNDADAGALMARTADVADVRTELAGYDVVFLAALVGTAAEEKARLVEHLGRHMAPGAALVVRSPHGARGFLYPWVVDPEEIRRGGFEVLTVHHPEDEVINSVIIARKAAAPAAVAADGDVPVNNGGMPAQCAVAVSRPCLGCACELGTRAHQKMKEMAMEEMEA
uniref:Nicotianamine synthase n=1 Tax=Triticum monococcum subsp. monococcum TaxID=408188 RepID=A0A2Z4HQJ9_TRIMO|nr:nicotianamine synthase [Triticum monococcum subsp. monococcum]